MKRELEGSTGMSKFIMGENGPDDFMGGQLSSMKDTLEGCRETKKGGPE